MFFCAISGEPPQDPVVSTKSGHVYERRLILKYITDNGTDPITGEKIEESDLISVKANPKTTPPRPPTLTSIPTILHTLQNEWDALVLETFALRQQYNSVRQQLSHALYTQDAATRVVARLMKERDAAREALANVQATIGIAPSNGASGDVEMSDQPTSDDAAGLPQDAVSRINETHDALSSTRRKRKPAPERTTPAQVKTFTARHAIPSLHSPSPAGITSIALSMAQPGLFVTGGNDKIVQLYDRGTDKVVATLKGHTKKTTRVALREHASEPTLVLSASADKTARIWAHDSASGEYAPRATLRIHKNEVTGLAVHPTSTFLALASLDRTYSITDLNTFQPVFQSASGGIEEPYTSLSVHPDGILLALGTSSSTIQIFDVRSGAVEASLVPEQGTPFTVNTLSFSENGYHLLAPDSTSSVAIWDLRKQVRARTIDLGENFKVNKVVYDYGAQFFGVAGSEGGRVFAHKSWEELVRLEEGGEMSDIAFSDLGKEVWGATGREVRIWGVPE
ncbi:nuclear matrix protein NMP200 [Rickenella mellea]|uniref:Pre-mRNA-processing factor 19 n=1 Tax=Rickenella mellea TaxID=50990 RepID=A0A4Y7QP92_9AGAM|nr:nuclear matrix protein NMP200 [Rickenella mellea]